MGRDSLLASCLISIPCLASKYVYRVYQQRGKRTDRNAGILLCIITYYIMPLFIYFVFLFDKFGQVFVLFLFFYSIHIYIFDIYITTQILDQIYRIREPRNRSYAQTFENVPTYVSHFVLMTDHLTLIILAIQLTKLRWSYRCM